MIQQKVLLQINDRVSALLGYDGTIVDVYPLMYKSGPFVDYLILGNSTTMDTLASNQIQTDQGAFFILDGLASLTVGQEYQLVIDTGTIVRIGDKENTTQAPLTV